MSNLIDIYHGSDKIVEKPVFGAGKIYITIRFVRGNEIRQVRRTNRIEVEESI